MIIYVYRNELRKKPYTITINMIYYHQYFDEPWQAQHMVWDLKSSSSYFPQPPGKRSYQSHPSSCLSNASPLVLAQLGYSNPSINGIEKLSYILNFIVKEITEEQFLSSNLCIYSFWFQFKLTWKDRISINPSIGGYKTSIGFQNLLFHILDFFSFQLCTEFILILKNHVWWYQNTT